MQLGAAAQRDGDQAVSPPSLPPRPCPAPPSFLIHPHKASLLPGGQCHPHLCHLPPVTAPSGSWGSHNPRSCRSCCCHIQPVQPTAPPDTRPRADRPKDAKKPISDTTRKHGPHSLPPLQPARCFRQTIFLPVFVLFPTIQTASPKLLSHHNHHNLLLSGLDTANTALLAPSHQAAAGIQPFPHPTATRPHTPNLRRHAAAPAPKTSPRSGPAELGTGAQTLHSTRHRLVPPRLQNPASGDAETLRPLPSTLRFPLWVIMVV